MYIWWLDVFHFTIIVKYIYIYIYIFTVRELPRAEDASQQDTRTGKNDSRAYSPEKHNYYLYK